MQMQIIKALIGYLFSFFDKKEDIMLIPLFNRTDSLSDLV